LSNTTGNANTADGGSALKSNTTGNNNTAQGRLALSSNTTGNRNTAGGANALNSNIDGNGNTAYGAQAMYNATNPGYGSTAIGVDALGSDTTGSENTAIGDSALYGNTTGQFNIAIGPNAGQNLTVGSNNIDIGNYNQNATNSTDVAGESNTIRIGEPTIHTAAFMAGIFGGATSSGVTVYVDSTGKLGTAPSSQRFKDEIAPMNKASEVILSLHPVTFRYKKELDPKSTPQFGLVAEEVAKVNPDLVARDAKGDIYSVRYEAVNAMLLNEFLKEHKKVEQLEKQIAALTAGLQKVSAQVELKQVAPQMAVNSP
jgi:hypothetical protein